MEKKNLVILDKVADAKDILDEIVKGEQIFNPDGTKAGRIVDVLVLDKKTREGQPYEQIQLVFEGTDSKRYTKNWSVDFCRKYFNQMGVKAADIHHAMVIFKLTDPKFKRAGMFMFVEAIEDEYYTCPYEDEGTDFSERLKKLGL